MGERAIKFIALLALSAALAGAPRPAAAAKRLNVQSWQPSPHSLDLFQVEGARVNHDYTANAYLMYNIAGRPMAPDVNLLGTLDLLVAASLLDRLSIGLGLPLHLHRSGDADNLAGFTAGDLRTSLKGAIIRPRRYGLGLALSFEVGIPTGQGRGFSAEAGATLRPRLILEAAHPRLHTALNIAYLARLHERSHTTIDDHEIVADDELQFLLGFGIPFGERGIELILETALASRVERFFQGGSTRLEISGGVRFRLPFDLALQTGAGVGVLDSWFHGFGEPSWRFFVSVGYMPATFAPEREADPCPWRPAGWSGPVDVEGCPVPDRDGDGVCDPWVAEHGLSDRFIDICTGVDRCPDLPGDQADGCPHPDRDGDGVCDPWVTEMGMSERYAHLCTGVDQCPDEPMGYDAPVDEHGCPVPDRDGDGVCDPWVAAAGQSERYANICTGIDLCPDEWGEGDDGCPLPEPEPEPEPDEDLYVTEEQIVIKENIFFETNRARIRQSSYPLLDRIASLILAHPELVRIEVQGHTDSRGRAAYNLRLSEQRAQSVRDYLIQRGGVAPTRLTARGYGLTRPIADNDTAEGRAANRRVEFRILERN